jgi:hypothetical protein
MSTSSARLQVQSNALAALEAIDVDMARDIMASGCVTGDRINGLCDGVSGEWYCKFDTYHPAVNNGMPVTRVISRVTLQEILAEYALKLGGKGTITNASKVISYREDTCNGRPRVRTRRLFYSSFAPSSPFVCLLFHSCLALRLISCGSRP